MVPEDNPQRVQEDQLEGEPFNLTVPYLMKWHTGQSHKPVLLSELQDFEIVLKCDHECTQRMPKHTLCFPIVSACAKTITFPTAHMEDYDSFETIMLHVIQSDHGFHRI